MSLSYPKTPGPNRTRPTVQVETWFRCRARKTPLESPDSDSAPFGTSPSQGPDELDPRKAGLLCKPTVHSHNASLIPTGFFSPITRSHQSEQSHPPKPPAPRRHRPSTQQNAVVPLRPATWIVALPGHGVMPWAVVCTSAPVARRVRSRSSTWPGVLERDLRGFFRISACCKVLILLVAVVS